jgi:DNA-binding MarR family transcriptional regulator
MTPRTQSSSEAQLSAPTPAELAADLSACLLFVKQRTGSGWFRLVEELGLSLTQIKALHLLDARNELSVKQLADDLELSLAAASRALDGLVVRELATRREDDHDRRFKRLTITTTGRDVVRRMTEAHLSGVENFTALLSPTERAQVAHALAPLLARDEIAACRPEIPTSDRR